LTFVGLDSLSPPPRHVPAFAGLHAGLDEKRLSVPVRFELCRLQKFLETLARLPKSYLLPFCACPCALVPLYYFLLLFCCLASFYFRLCSVFKVHSAN
jgi:hypothetical protein